MIIADIAVAPLRPYKGEEEMYKVVDACIEIIQNSGLNYEIGAMSTTVEGEFDEVFEIIKKHINYLLNWDVKSYNNC